MSDELQAKMDEYHARLEATRTSIDALLDQLLAQDSDGMAPTPNQVMALIKHAVGLSSANANMIVALAEEIRN